LRVLDRPELAFDCNLPISASSIARIRNMHQHTWLMGPFSDGP
jgi:hypothetical protein